MPAFVRTKSDEARWSRAKEAAGKETNKDSESYWKLSNYIYHKMGKTEGDQKMANFYKQELIKANVTVKTPRQKSMPGPDAKPSVFFKAEEVHPKHPNVQKLYDFMANCKLKKCGCSNL